MCVCVCVCVRGGGGGGNGCEVSFYMCSTYLLPSSSLSSVPVLPVKGHEEEEEVEDIDWSPFPSHDQSRVPLQKENSREEEEKRRRWGCGCVAIVCSIIIMHLLVCFK